MWITHVAAAKTGSAGQDTWSRRGWHTQLEDESAAELDIASVAGGSDAGVCSEEWAGQQGNRLAGAIVAADLEAHGKDERPVRAGAGAETDGQRQEARDRGGAGGKRASARVGGWRWRWRQGAEVVKRNPRRRDGRRR